MKINKIYLIIIGLIILLIGGLLFNKDKSEVKELNGSLINVMMTNGEVRIIDVRMRYEYDLSHIKGAINIPLDEIVEFKKVYPDKNEIYVIYCQSGNRSGQAKKKLEAMGYTNIYDYGSINNWKGEFITN